jgi:hypothetical protein
VNDGTSVTAARLTMRVVRIHYENVCHSVFCAFIFISANRPDYLYYALSVMCVPIHM